MSNNGRKAVLYVCITAVVITLLILLDLANPGQGFS